MADTAIRSGKIQKPGLVLAFCAGGLDAEEFFRGLKSVVGPDVPIVGGSAVGIITNNDLSYENEPAGAAVIEWKRRSCSIASTSGLDRDEMKAGRDLARHFRNKKNGQLLLVFYDSIKQSPTETTPPVMNASPPLIAGIEEGLPPHIPIIGAGLVGDYDFSPTFQFCGSHVARQSVVGTLMQGDFSCYYQIMHGCTPKDGIYHTITKIEGPVIYEIDGRPAVKVINELYGDTEWQKQMPVKRLTIGINYGEKYGDYDEKEYVNRLIAGTLPDEAGIVIFEPDLGPGTEIQFMLRDSRTMIESVKSNPVQLMARIRAEGRQPFLGLYIDCAGRTASFSDTLIEEAAEISQVFDREKVPLLGFYSGVEIAPLLGKSRGLDWTGVLLVFAEEV